MKKLYNFEDFVTAVNKHGTAIEMQPEEFKMFENKLSKSKDAKYPHLCDVAEVAFKRNSTKMFWKENFMDVGYKQSEFV